MVSTEATGGRVLCVCVAALALSLGAGAAAQSAAPPAGKPPAVSQALPPADDILADAVAAMGGEEALLKIASSRIEAEKTAPGGRLPPKLQMYWAKPDRFVYREITGRRVVTIAYDGRTGWAINPMTGDHVLLTDEQVDQFKGQTDLHLRLLTLKDEFEKIETIDVTDFDGRQCFKLRLIPKNEDTPPGQPMPQVHAFFDVKTKLYSGMQVAQEAMLGPRTTIKFKEWKETEGVLYFRRMIMDQGQAPTEMKITEIELNQVDPKVFEPPEEVKELARQREEDEAARRAKEDPAEEPEKEGADRQ